MQPPKAKQIVTKQEGAKVQIEAAIDALETGNFAAAITLAGAAEGMLESDGVDIVGALKNSDLDRALQKKFITWLNDERDWLKHVTKDDPRKTLELSPVDAALMIARAVTKVAVWESAKIAEFQTWFSSAVADRAKLLEGEGRLPSAAKAGGVG
jgi:hypothetical protein